MRLNRTSADAKSRRGAGFIVVVLMLLLVIMGATQVFLRGTLQERKRTQRDVRNSTLRNAIEEVHRHGQPKEKFVFPVDSGPR